MSRLTRLAVTMLEKEQDIGAPPEPPEEDEGEGADEEGWDFDSLQKKFGLKAQVWAESSPNARKIKLLIRDRLLSTKPTVRVTHVNFPGVPWEKDNDILGSAQVEWEWLMREDVEWGELDDQIEAVLKRSSDLAKVFGVDQRQIWNVIDKGDVYGFLMEMLVIVYASVSNDNKKNTLKSDVGFGWYELMEANRAKYEQNLIKPILKRMPKVYARWFQEHGVKAPQIKFETPNKNQIHLWGSRYGGEWWGKVIVMWPFSFIKIPSQDRPQSSRVLSR